MNHSKTMSPRPWLALLLLFLPLLGRAQEKLVRLPASPRDLERLLRTDYYGLYFNGAKIGWAKSACQRIQQGGEPLYVSTEDSSIKLLVLGRKTEIRRQERYEFDSQPLFALRGGSARESDGESTKEVTLRRTKAGFEATIKAGGETTKQTLAAIDFTLADLTTLSVWIRRGPRPGDSIAFRTFDFDDLKIQTETHKLRATKTTKLQGVTAVFHELDVTRPNEGTSLARIDEQGDQVLSHVVAKVLEFRVEPEKLAKNTQFGADLFELGKAKIDKKLGDSSPITSLVLQTVGKNELHLKSGPWQTISRNPDGAYTIHLGKRHGTPAPASPREIADNLAETTDYPIHHPKIVALARQAVGDATSPRDKVERLVHFVHGFITPSYSVQPLTVLDLLKVRKGCCTNYAALFATLARASGIPCRDLGGLVYMGDDEKAFGFHAWNEVVLDGHWAPVDPTADETELQATHINFGSVAGEQAMNMFESFNQLSFRLVEVKHAPENSKPQGPKQP